MILMTADKTIRPVAAEREPTETVARYISEIADPRHLGRIVGEALMEAPDGSGEGDDSAAETEEYPGLIA